MKFGIIGTGMIGAFHAKAIAAMEGSELVGVADMVVEKATAFAAENDCKAFGSVEEMLADPGIDIVTIGTPSGAHYDPGMAAIEAGKHVVVEKPLEVTTARIDEMTAAAKAKGVSLSAILNRRFQILAKAEGSPIKGGGAGSSCCPGVAGRGCRLGPRAW